jgi:aldehyde dehydrogenase (NAD+)
MIHFTGSTPVGKRIMATAAQGVKKVALELGGKSASIALEDADVEAVVRFNVPRMARHSGQGCTNLTRLLLPRAKYELGLEIAAEVGPQVRWGDPCDPGTHMGPQISAAHQQQVVQHIDRARGEGGRVITGGGVPDGCETGFFVEATVIADVHPDAAFAQEEIFGPVLAVIPYDTEDEAVTIANNSAFGLSGAVWSASDERALAVARRVRTGTMDVNGGTWFARDSPFGGMKQSGLGREWGEAGFEEYLDVRVIGYPLPA